MSIPLAELHIHFQGCIRPADLLKHLTTSKNVDWEWYESEYRAAYESTPPTRQLVERFRSGDLDAAKEFEEICTFNDADAGHFNRFSGKGNIFWAGSYLSKDPNEVAQERLKFAKTIREDFIARSIKYAEFRHSDSLALLQMFDNNDSDLTMRLAVSLDRQDPWPRWDSVKELALGPNGKALTAIDFCGKEEGFPPKILSKFLTAVHEFNQQHPKRALAILYHVGESFNDKSLESAIRWVQEAAELGAHRLGHAIALGIDPDFFGIHGREESVAERKDQIAYDIKHHIGLRAAGVFVDRSALHAELKRLESLPENSKVVLQYDAQKLDEMRRRQGYAIECIRSLNTVIEVCPTSNRRIAGIANPAHHPVHRFIDKNIPVIISTDDPGQFGITLEGELDWVCSHTNGGQELREKLVSTSWESRSEILSGRIELA